MHGKAHGVLALFITCEGDYGDHEEGDSISDNVMPGFMTEMATVVMTETVWMEVMTVVV